MNDSVIEGEGSVIHSLKSKMAWNMCRLREFRKGHPAKEKYYQNHYLFEPPLKLYFGVIFYICYWLDISIRADTIRLTCTQPSFPLLWSERLHEVFILVYLFVKINSLKCWTCVSTADILSYHDQYILRTLETSWRWKLRTSKNQQIR